MTIPATSCALLSRLRDVLLSLPRPAYISNKAETAIAFSGGLDSRFLAFAAQKMGIAVKLFHISGPHTSAWEDNFARVWAARQKLPLTIVELNPLMDSRVAFNDKSRCYFCKKDMFVELLHSSSALPLCDGSHCSDNTGYRPGRAALHELGIHSPLEKAGFSKADIRRVAVELGMDIPWQKARPCLLTRFPYDMEATPILLNELSSVEEKLQILLQKWTHNAGAAEDKEPDFRVRICRILTDIPSGAEVELHIQNSELPFLQNKLFISTCRELFCFSTLKLTAIRYMDNLSGYFDK